jgi:sugar phosphate isomerase/epimerase
MGAQGIQVDALNELPPSDLSDTAVREFLKQLADAGLSVASLHFPARRTYFDEEFLDERIAATRRTMELAYRLKTRVVTVKVGHVPPEPDSPQHELLVQVLNDLARYGNHVGAVLAITPSKDTSDQLVRLLQRVTDGPIGIDFDPPGFIWSDEDVASAFRELHEFVVHVQVRDAVHEIDGTALEVPVGRGAVRWEELLVLLEDAGYRDWLTVVRTSGDDRAGDMRRAVAYLRTLAREV